MNTTAATLLEALSLPADPRPEDADALGTEHSVEDIMGAANALLPAGVDMHLVQAPDGTWGYRFSGDPSYYGSSADDPDLHHAARFALSIAICVWQNHR